MLKNYFKVAFRNLVKHKGSTLINIAGLAIGVAAFLIIGLYLYNELSYDKYHKNADRIVRIVEDLRTENELLFQAASSPPMGPAFKDEFPEVEEYVRFTRRTGTVRKAGNNYIERDMLLADSTVFEVFSFPVIDGDPTTMLRDPFSLVLTRTYARKYFGDKNPIGQSLEISGDDYMITGVIQDIPQYSHFTFNLLISFSTFSSQNRNAEENAWFWNGFMTYLLLKDSDQLSQLQSNIPYFIKKYMPNETQMYYQDLPLQRLTDIYLAKPRAWEFGERGSKTNVYVLSIIALFILIIATINYVNLATAQSSRRMNEVGLRKVVGAEKALLIRQFLGESVIVSVLATVIGFGLALLILPFFNDMLETSLSFDLLNGKQLFLGLVSFGVLLGLCAGIYPAIFIAAFHPLLMFKNSQDAIFSNNLLRRVLVTAQFIVSICLIADTMLVLNQLDHIREANLGFAEAQTLVLNTASVDRNRLGTIKEQLKKIPGVYGISASSNVPGYETTNLYTMVETQEGSMSPTNINTISIDEDFIPNYEIGMIAGRNFSVSYPTDEESAFIMNKQAVDNLGYHSPEEAIGRKIDQQGHKGRIIGVVEDFNYKSIHSEIEPLLIHCNHYWFENLSIKVSSNNIQDVVETVGVEWDVLSDGMPYEYSFLDENFNRLYQSEIQLSKVVAVFCSLAIFIACMGLLGLTAFNVQRRFKEIGIRKVLGASTFKVIYLVSRETMILIILSFFIAVPVVYFGINWWLTNFTERISINPVVLVLAGAITFIVAGLTISSMSFKAATSNPAEALRDD